MQMQFSIWMHNNWILIKLYNINMYVCSDWTTGVDKPDWINFNTKSAFILNYVPHFKCV